MSHGVALAKILLVTLYSPTNLLTIPPSKESVKPFAESAVFNVRGFHHTLCTFADASNAQKLIKLYERGQRKRWFENNGFFESVTISQTTRRRLSTEWEKTRNGPSEYWPS